MQNEFRKIWLFSFAETISNADVEILSVNATDLDSGANAEISYTLKSQIPGFTIGTMTGILYANTSKINRPIMNYIQLSVCATDAGIPPLSSVATVRIQVNSNSYTRPQFLQNQYRYVTIFFLLKFFFI